MKRKPCLAKHQPFGEGRTFVMPVDHCPFCAAKTSRATLAAGSSGPKPGNPSICMKCLAVSVFGKDLKLRRPSARERRVFLNDRGLQYTLAVLETGKTLVASTTKQF
jgi:hypothetical protein